MEQKHITHLARSAMNKLAVLSHGGHKETKELFKTKKRQFPFCFTLNWNGENNADYALHKPTQTGQSMFLLYELVRRDHPPFEYYMFCDDDVLFPGGDINKRITGLLEEYKPLAAWFPIVLKPTGKKRAWCIRKVSEIKGVQRSCCSDECTHIYHYSVLENLYPFLFHGSMWTVNFIDWVLYNLHPAKCMRFSDIWVRNSGHRACGKGHGLLRETWPITREIWDPVLKKRFGAFKDHKEWLIKHNAEIAGDGVSKKEVVLSDISGMVKTDESAWQNRKWLLPEYEKFITKGMP